MPSELEQAIELDVDAIHVELTLSLQRIGLLTQKLRSACFDLPPYEYRHWIHHLSKLAMGGKPTPFGLDESELNNALMYLRDFPLIELKGFHFHFDVTPT
ncbi:hypothetical protein O9929_24790 [Vibrio lentus]|nr:hypothetical protein [Vibrio lentus]